jgi:preprotein translocase subunit YajC
MFQINCKQLTILGISIILGGCVIWFLLCRKEKKGKKKPKPNINDNLARKFIFFLF